MRLRILSYNIHRAIGLDRRFRLERIVEIIRHYNPDIALLQEVDSGAPRSRSLDLASALAEALEFPHHAVGLNVKLRRGHYGNATLSRFAITRERNIDLTIGTRKRRGCQHTRLQIERDGARRSLDVFNLHLGLSERERIQQIGRLVHSEEFTGMPAGPCILGGDFNDWRGTLPMVIQDVLGFQCSSGANGGKLIRTYPSISPTGSLDRIFFRGPLKVAGAHSCRLALSRVASDHLPLIVDFDL